MQVVYATDHQELDLSLHVNRPEATIADLLDALPNGARAEGLTIDGRFCDADLGIAESGLYAGALLSATREREPPAAAHESAFEIHVVAGADAGRIFPISANELVVGRERTCEITIDDPSVSRRHCELRVQPGGSHVLTDLGSANGTIVNGRPVEGERELRAGELVEVGDVAFVVAPAGREDIVRVDPLRQVGAGGTIAFNRPPRALAKAEEAVLQTPDKPGAHARAPFNVAALLGPLAMGAVMVAITRNPAFALFILLSPVMLVFNWWESRRRSHQASRRGQREFRASLKRFEDELRGESTARSAAARRAFPDLAEIVRRAEGPSQHLWERRMVHDDFLRLQAGYGDVPWSAPVPDTRSERPPEVLQALKAHSKLRAFPVEVDLSDGGVVGIVGSREIALGVARGLLCQAAVLHGPADAAVAVLADEGRATDWEWAKWLPHTRDTEARGEARLLADGPEEAQALAQELLRRKAEDPERARVTLAVIDGERLTAGRASPARSFLRGTGSPAAGIVLAAAAEELPAVCTAVLDVNGGIGDSAISRPLRGERVDSLLASGMSSTTALRCARALARFDDPEWQSSGAGLPDGVGLLPLLELPELDSSSVLDRWRSAARAQRLASPIGVCEEGTFTLDWVGDGPHGLIGGTTGSGKSELLRTIVAGLAVTHDPEHLNFVLIDYKGGSAFAECAQLPHTVGLVTDLDEQLGARALRSLEAELRHRESVLRGLGAENLKQYLEKTAGEPRAEPLPRLLVVIDEFATMAAELPDFITALVGIAQRGRSLGVHLLLATQRPSGVVNENIRANTNIRISLRMQSGQDSSDVIETLDAAQIPRSLPGRAYVRLGKDEIVAIQTALITGSSPAETVTPVDVSSFEFGRIGRAPKDDHEGVADESDLARLVHVVGGAFEAGGAQLPRRPWLEPLPALVSLEDLLRSRASSSLLGDAADCASFAIADDPDAQAQYAVGWDLAAGNLLVYGIPGSGTTSCLQALAVSLASAYDADVLHIYGLDFGAGGLGVLAPLPHVGAVVPAADRERQVRLLRTLGSELERRRALTSEERTHEPRIVVMLDGFGAFRSEFDDIEGAELQAQFARVFGEGQDLRIHCVLAADRPNAMPSALASLARQRMLFQLADPYEFTQFGIRRDQVPKFTPGRALVGGTGQLVQVGFSASLDHAIEAIATRGLTGAHPPRQIDVLPAQVTASSIAGAARLESDPWFLPIGIAEQTLAPAGLTIYESEHALIAGAARTGKSTTLCAIAEILARRGGLRTDAIADRRSPVRDSPHLAHVASSAEEIKALLDELATGRADPAVLLVDDAERMEDAADPLADLLATTPPHLHVIAAGRPENLRPLYNHWTQVVRRFKLGVLLQPDLQRDGDLLNAVLPRRQTRANRPGLGYVVSGSDAQLVQVAMPFQDAPRSSVAETGTR